MKSIKLETSKKFKHYGNKVKQVGLHPTKPLVLMAHYNGEVSIFNYATQALAKRSRPRKSPCALPSGPARTGWSPAATT